MSGYDRNKETQRIRLGDVPGLERVPLSGEVCRALPWGTFKLDEQGRVIKYNPFSRGNTLVEPEELVGKNFFQEIMPFPQIQGFYQEFLTAARARTLYQEFKFSVLPEALPPFTAQIVLYHSKNTDSFWAVFSRVG